MDSKIADLTARSKENMDAITTLKPERKLGWGGGAPRERPPTCRRRWQRSGIGATPHCRAVSAVWGGLDRDGCLLSVQGSGNRAFMLPDAFRVGS